ncbi:hypothetical protein NFX46_01990 [Streptomyces phaeoluteigriseus]|uniref:Uncharacterized protein n=1 Tax=Streptomyces phaeoluteigriseus TaxID=114686 RepID=A0ABY4Z0U8_9ACTN|nr:hypothetical protein [Streptomyces phaeoluteigriseus]USQ82646.1 hypothetical protein NFX46_01990 [Streptomyces phaeoluteigriseus]
MAAKKKVDEPPEEPSRTAGGCVLVVLAGVVVGAAFAVDQAAGVLLVVVTGTFALWRSARRVSDSSATPPPGEDRPSCRECAGHELASVTPLEGQKGMLIYKVELPNRPGHTHIHIAGEATTP